MPAVASYSTQCSLIYTLYILVYSHDVHCWIDGRWILLFYFFFHQTSINIYDITAHTILSIGNDHSIVNDYDCYVFHKYSISLPYRRGRVYIKMNEIIFYFQIYINLIIRKPLACFSWDKWILLMLVSGAQIGLFIYYVTLYLLLNNWGEKYWHLIYLWHLVLSINRVMSFEGLWNL